MSNLLTIVIPTRDRLDTLRILVHYLLWKPIQKVRLLVVDNFSDPPVEDMLPVHNFLRVVRSKERLSMPDNWRFGLSFIETPFFTVMGDDDFPWKSRITKLVARLDSSQANLFTWHRGAFYWPNYADMNMAGSLIIQNGFHYRNLTCTILYKNMFLKTFDWTHLPSVYNSIVSVDLATSLHGNLSSLIPDRCIAPDGSSAIKIATTFSEVSLLASPVIISGISNHSNGMAWQQNAGKFYGEFKNYRLFPSWLQSRSIACDIHGLGLLTFISDYCVAVVDGGELEADSLPKIFFKKLMHYSKAGKVKISDDLTSILRDAFIGHSNEDFPLAHDVGVLPVPNGFTSASFRASPPNSCFSNLEAYLESNFGHEALIEVH